MKSILSIIEEISQNEPDATWISHKTFTKNTVINNKNLISHFVIVADGIIHLEITRAQILQFYKEGDMIYQSPYDINVHDQVSIVCDTDTKLIFVDREIFSDFAANKTEYMEVLLKSVLKNTSDLCLELMKHDLTVEPRITYTLQKFCDRVAPTLHGEYQEIPDFLNKSKLAHYGNFSRKSLYDKLDSLEEQDIIKQHNQKLYIKTSAS
ncbi:Crp/Fnr family transcriptional regulator [Listeria rustica]|uniref:Crp/Fnr family transcriptional regulator n=1 Tax=Listeria rustica TaxID=2713503 RepID=A0A7W1T782_9LIST|nr:Crp/Fnr family transcriptional regulator [Listeria rustica]MBA3926771.1 Crp/Fnr family transcriptional regulator [Listeria rustica]